MARSSLFLVSHGAAGGTPLPATLVPQFAVIRLR